MWQTFAFPSSPLKLSQCHRAQPISSRHVVQHDRTFSQQRAVACRSSGIRWRNQVAGSLVVLRWRLLELHSVPSDVQNERRIGRYTGHDRVRRIQVHHAGARSELRQTHFRRCRTQLILPLQERCFPSLHPQPNEHVTHSEYHHACHEHEDDVRRGNGPEVLLERCLLRVCRQTAVHGFTACFHLGTIGLWTRTTKGDVSVRQSGEALHSRILVSAFFVEETRAAVSSLLPARGAVFSVSCPASASMSGAIADGVSLRTVVIFLAPTVQCKVADGRVERGENEDGESIEAAPMTRHCDRLFRGYSLG